ncbi:MAG: DUF3793 family protein [Clostridiales Family XIII bacterium]|nr:DUF3793 family protein [Clostridiales Family XIII bacterium]
MGIIETVFLDFAAPVLRGAKPAALMLVKPRYLPDWARRQRALRRATGLATLEVGNRGGGLLVLVYDRAAMRSLLVDGRATALLSRYGYPLGRGRAAVFRHLRSRFSDAGTGFPHEVGVFLGYPTEDVRGFIENKGRNCVFCYYWKVYHDLERAQEIFRRIDEARRYARVLLRESMSIHVAASLLKASAVPQPSRPMVAGQRQLLC